MRERSWGSLAICVALGLGCTSGRQLDSSTDSGSGTDTDPGTDAGTETAPGTTNGTSGAATSDEGPTSGEASTATGASTSASSTTTTTTTSPSTSPPDDDGPPPLGPGCSVQVVTQGAEFSPLPRGGAGEFPAPVADVLEDYCGCHTLSDNSENIEWKFLLPPGGTLFLSYADLGRSYEGSTLGATMAAVTLKDMPPGSCPRPSDPLAVLTDWFEQGLPDGVDYVE